MTWAIRQNPVITRNSGNASSPSLTSGPTTLATIAGNPLLVFVWGFELAFAAISVTDTSGNTYHLDQQTLTTNGASVALFSCLNPLALPTSSTVTVSVPGATNNSFWGFLVFEYTTGAGTASFDTGANGVEGTLQTPSAGPTGTIAGGNELVFQACCFWAASGTGSVSGYTATAHDGPITNINGWGAWQSLNSSGTVTAAAITWSASVSGSVAVVGVYKVSSAGSVVRVPSLPTVPTVPILA